MRLHENWKLFSDALQAASQPVADGGLGIKNIFIEKDYWICRALSLMAAKDKDKRAIFKGGHEPNESIRHRKEIFLSKVKHYPKSFWQQP